MISIRIKPEKPQPIIKRMTQIAGESIRCDNGGFVTELNR